MHRGLFIPQFGELADLGLLADLGRRAERAGWDGLFLWDHIQYRPPADRVLDPWIALAAIGAVTDRLRLGAMVTPLARRRPWVVARQLAIVVDLLSGQTVHHHGRHYLVDGATFLPTPVQSPLPVWVATRWPNRAPLRRAARYQGVFAINVATPTDAGQLRRRADMPRSEGGATGSFDIVLAPEPGWPAQAWAQAGVTWLLTPFSQFEAWWPTWPRSSTPGRPSS